MIDDDDYSKLRSRRSSTRVAEELGPISVIYGSISICQHIHLPPQLSPTLPAPRHEMSSHETDSPKPPAKQEPEDTSHSHDSIGARLGEGVSYVSFLAGVCTTTYAQLNRHKISGAMKFIHGNYDPLRQLLLPCMIPLTIGALR